VWMRPPRMTVEDDSVELGEMRKVLRALRLAREKTAALIASSKKEREEFEAATEKVSQKRGPV
jgi:hypothetical protein